ncbi:hypothetical protein HU200_062140 [Digitaria exilis]|uniref:Retrotransposon gag domain-containing protein n=1 Tax=Digitaria exilis TaxID=1010633 RepID=A0A835DYX3_9POAL|nr:hypothetical protein HU200_062140 [Digitaria exilis]
MAIAANDQEDGVLHRHLTRAATQLPPAPPPSHRRRRCHGWRPAAATPFLLSPSLCPRFSSRCCKAGWRRSSRHCCCRSCRRAGAGPSAALGLVRDPLPPWLQPPPPDLLLPAPLAARASRHRTSLLRVHAGAGAGAGPAPPAASSSSGTEAGATPCPPAAAAAAWQGGPGCGPTTAATPAAAAAYHAELTALASAAGLADPADLAATAGLRGFAGSLPLDGGIRVFDPANSVGRPLRDTGKQASDGAVSAEAALAASLRAAKAEAAAAEAAAAEERVRVASATWARERATADALARRVGEAERYLHPASSSQPVVPYTDPGASSLRRPPLEGSRDHLPDPVVTQLHLQALGVQHIRGMVSIVLDSTSTSYNRWRDQVLMALRRYHLTGHVLADNPEAARDTMWHLLDTVVLSWISGTVAQDLQDSVNTLGGTVRAAWLALENQFLGHAETRALQLSAAFANFVQGDLSVGEYCRKMKSMADSLADLGCPVEDRLLVLHILRGLNDTFDHIRDWITRQRPFPSYLQVRDDLVLKELTLRPQAPLTPSPSSTALPPHFLVLLPPGRTGVGGTVVAVVAVVGIEAALVGDAGDHRLRLHPCALAILLQPMVRAHLDVALSGSGRRASCGCRTCSVGPDPGGWDQAALAQSFSTMGLTPPSNPDWIADSGASYHTTPDPGILSSARSPPISCPSSIMPGTPLHLPPPVFRCSDIVFFCFIRCFRHHIYFHDLAPSTQSSRPRRCAPS